MMMEMIRMILCDLSLVILLYTNISCFILRLVSLFFPNFIISLCLLLLRHRLPSLDSLCWGIYQGNIFVQIQEIFL